MHSLRKVFIVLFGIIGISCALAVTKDAPITEQSAKIDGIDAEKSTSSILNRISIEQVNSIVTEMFGGISTAISPLLGPLAPISDILGSVITNSVTELITTLLNQTLSSTEEQSTDQVKGYKTFIVTIPKHGKFVLHSKTSKRQEKLLALDSVDEVRGTLDEFMMERAGQAKESNDNRQKIQIAKSKKKPIFKKNVDSYLIPLN